MLTQQQIELYREDGAVVVPGVLDAATCKLMKTCWRCVPNHGTTQRLWWLV